MTADRPAPPVEPAQDLRVRLIDARLACAYIPDAGDGHPSLAMRSNGDAADLALATIAEAGYRLVPSSATPAAPPVDPSTTADPDWGDNHCLARFVPATDHDGLHDAIVECETRSAARDAELAKLREQLASREQAESWIEYGTRWLGEKPTPDSSDVAVWGDTRENYTRQTVNGPHVVVVAKDSAQSAAGDYDRDGYPCRVEFRIVTAGPWQHTEDAS